MKTGYKYFAYISYCHKDKEWVEWIQQELENFFLQPSFYSINGIPQNIRAVFREDELDAGDLLEQIHNALEESMNLIVICSPKAATSELVNQEINTFIEVGALHGTDNVAHIFPFIVDGIPYSKNLECYP